MDRRAKFQKNPGRSTDQIIIPNDKNNDLIKNLRPKKTVRIQEEPAKKTTKFNIDKENEEAAPKISITKADKKDEEKEDDSSDSPPIKRRITKNESQNNKKMILANLKCERKASMRWDKVMNPLSSEGLDFGDSKMITQSKLNRLKSAMPPNMLDNIDSSSDSSDPEIKRLKRKAGI